MSSDSDSAVGKINKKAKAIVHGLLGDDDSSGEADPDIEYEPKPKQKVLQDGMVVLSESQTEHADAAGADSATDATGTTGDASAEDRSDASKD